MKWMIYITILMLSIISSKTVAQINKITACKFCGSVGNEYAAKSVLNWNQSGLVYVIDFQNRTGYKYNVYIDYIKKGSNKFQVHKVQELTLNSIEKDAIFDIFYIYDEIKKSIQPYTNSQHSIQNTSRTSQSSSPFDLGTVTVINPRITAHDFLLTSKFRNDMYQSHINLKTNKNIPSLINKITDSLSLGAFHLKDLKLGYKIEFYDGSSLVVTPNLTTETLDVVENTAKDFENNSIPTNRNMILGNYHFSSVDSYNGMRQYLETMFGIIGLQEMTCTNYVMQCSFVGTTLTCSVPQCAY